MRQQFAATQQIEQDGLMQARRASSAGADSYSCAVTTTTMSTVVPTTQQHEAVHAALTAHEVC
jgi:hypothetical protein